MLKNRIRSWKFVLHILSLKFVWIRIDSYWLASLPITLNKNCLGPFHSFLVQVCKPLASMWIFGKAKILLNELGKMKQISKIWGTCSIKLRFLSLSLIDFLYHYSTHKWLLSKAKMEYVIWKLLSTPYSCVTLSDRKLATCYTVLWLTVANL